MMDDGRCHICRQWPDREDRSYSVTTCVSCEATAAAGEVERGNRAALILAIISGLGLVWLLMVGQPQCANPVTEKIGSVSLWDSCGTTRKREAVNDD